MKIRQVVCALLLFSCGTVVLEASTDSSLEEAGKSWWEHVRFLADDKLEGRDTGSPGFKIAADYLVAQFQQAGLKPAGTDGFFQPISFQVVQLDETQSKWEIERNSDHSTVAIGSDVNVAVRSNQDETIDAEAVFVGYGFAVPERSFNEVAGLDLRGKVAVALTGSPSQIFGPIRQYYQSPRVRWNLLREAGAIGLITIPNPKSGLLRERSFTAQPTRPVWLLADQTVSETPGLRLSATVNPAGADVLLRGSGHTLAELQALSDADKPLPKFNLDGKLHVRLAVKKLRDVTSTNVIGVLPGSDPLLKKETVVLIAHLDHLGVGRAVDGDSIYKGAMDNGSGVASLIEIAKALGKATNKPKRSIVFLSTTGEEKGVFGSEYFVAHPTVERKGIVAAINMDMFLPLFPLHYLEVQGLGESTLGDEIRGAAQEHGVEVQFDKQPAENRFVRGDHANFIKVGIPGVGFKAGWIPDSPEEKTFNDWIRTRYHKPSDDLNQPVDIEAGALFTRIVADFAQRVANNSSRPAWYRESFMSRAAASGQ